MTATLEQPPCVLADQRQDLHCNFTILPTIWSCDLDSKQTTDEKAACLHDAISAFHHEVNLEQWKHKVTNKEILDRTGLSSLEDLLIKKKLLWTGYLLRISTGILPKQILYSELSYNGYMVTERVDALVSSSRTPSREIRETLKLTHGHYSQQITKWRTALTS